MDFMHTIIIMFAGFHHVELHSDRTLPTSRKTFVYIFYAKQRPQKLMSSFVVGVLK